MMGFPRWFISTIVVTLDSAMAHARQIQPKSGPENAFGIVLREVREEAGLSQLDVYTKFGIDRTQLSAIERGVQSPTLRTIDRCESVSTEAFRIDASNGEVPLLSSLAPHSMLQKIK